MNENLIELKDIDEDYLKDSDEDYIKQNIGNNLPSLKKEDHKIIQEQEEHNVCQIVKKNNEKGTGFFCKIPIEKGKYFMKTLITNNHVLNENDIKPNNQIDFIINDKITNKRTIFIDSKKCSYTNEKYDTTIIQLKKEIDDVEYFEVDNKIFKERKDNDNFLKNKGIYIIHYPKKENNEQVDSVGEKVCYNPGKIIAISKNPEYKIKHDCYTNKGSSGGPLIDTETKKVIGIHKGTEDKKGAKYNLGTLLNFPIKEFEESESNKEKINEFKKSYSNAPPSIINIYYNINSYISLSK